DQTADRFGDAPAVAYQNVRWTYAELLARVNRVAAGLATLGVRKGDHVLMTLPNCPEFVSCFFAIQKLGAVVVNAGPLIGSDDLHELIKLARPRVAIGLDLQAGVLTRAARECGVEHFVWTSLQSYQTLIKRVGYRFKLWHSKDSKRHAEGNGDGKPHATKGKVHASSHGHAHKAQHVALHDLTARCAARPPTVAPDPGDVAVLQPTGGTTGTLKLAELTHRSLLANCTQVATWMNVRIGQERFLSVLPMFHVYGLNLCLVAAVYSAGTMVLMTRYETHSALDLIRREGVTIFPLVPAICDALSNLLEEEGGATDGRPLLPTMRLCISGAAPLPPASGERFMRLTGSAVIEGYGLTEASPVTHAGLPGDPRPATIGLPMPDTRVRVIDPETGDDVRPGETGELIIAGPQLMSGYYGNPEQTRAVLQTDADGTTWLHTGDLVTYDAEGFFHVVDRRKDMIIRSGLKVYPGRVEHALRKHAKVADVAVVGRADPQHTEKVVAVVVTKDVAPEHRRALAAELRTHCREHLAPYEVPAVIEFVDALPRSALGKLLRRELRKAPGESTVSDEVEQKVRMLPDDNPEAAPADAKPDTTRPPGASPTNGDGRSDPEHGRKSPEHKQEVRR
ncbi:MAG: AMP-binding protein, partial [Phycisphaerae bacterium]